LKAIVKSVATTLDAQGALSKAPKSLGGKSATELLADGTLKIDVDPKYPQAIGVASITHRVSLFGNSPWEILRSGGADCPFITSDYPAAIEVVDLNTPINRIVPLAPDLAIRICPDIRLRGTEPGLTFANFAATRRQLKRAETHDLIYLIARCGRPGLLSRSP
jgi:hypothetical protein